jgi:hypothetical protein
MSRVEVLSVSTSQLAYMLDGRQPSSGSISSARPKFSNCKLSGPMAGSAAASKQILKLGVILALRRISIMNDMERIERDMLRLSDEPLQVRVETFNRLMLEFLSKYGSPGIQERLGSLLNKEVKLKEGSSRA